eukprot:scaffold233_cov198-Chaetoceros_neogracile.AAC.15
MRFKSTISVKEGAQARWFEQYSGRPKCKEPINSQHRRPTVNIVDVSTVKESSYCYLTIYFSKKAEF